MLTTMAPKLMSQACWGKSRCFKPSSYQNEMSSNLIIFFLNGTSWILYLFPEWVSSVAKLDEATAPLPSSWRRRVCWVSAGPLRPEVQAKDKDQQWHNHHRLCFCVNIIVRYPTAKHSMESVETAQSIFQV